MIYSNPRKYTFPIILLVLVIIPKRVKSIIFDIFNMSHFHFLYYNYTEIIILNTNRKISDFRRENEKYKKFYEN